MERRERGTRWPWMDLRGYSPRWWRADLLSALVVTFLGVPQGVAYAVIAGMPPAMGLYASALPTLVGALTRSSRHVVTGPTNAVSLLVGAGVALLADQDPMAVGVTLALLVGLFQVGAGALRLGAVVDYISSPVVLGYITGAGLLIAVGQLHRVTGSPGGQGQVLEKISAWLAHLEQASALSIAVALGSAALILLLRRVHRGIPGALVTMVAATALSVAVDLQGHGLQVVADLEPITAGLPPLTLPSLPLVGQLVPLAAAVAVLSLVESTSVAREIAARSQQRLELSTEFIGQGLSNLAAAFSGGYPTSGSLTRSALNQRAPSRLAGALSGLLMLAVMALLGPWVNHTPLASLAGLLLVVAADLVKVPRIKTTWSGPLGDKVAFGVTALGTWQVPLDQAIFLGVGISLVLFLRKARVLAIRELTITPEGRLREQEPGKQTPGGQRCQHVRLLHIEGRMFFGARGELQQALDQWGGPGQAQVLVLRIKRTQGMDVTQAQVLAQAAERMRARGQRLLLTGVKPAAMEVLARTGAVASLGEANIFPVRRVWFGATRAAIARAQELTQEAHRGQPCPLVRYLNAEPYLQTKGGPDEPTDQDLL